MTDDRGPHPTAGSVAWCPGGYLPDYWILILPCSRHGAVRGQQRLRSVEQFPSTTCGNDGEADAIVPLRSRVDQALTFPMPLAQASELGLAGRRRHTYMAKRSGATGGTTLDKSPLAVPSTPEDSFSHEYGHPVPVGPAPLSTEAERERAVLGVHPLRTHAVR
jgi:hypothetical protein